MKQLYKPIMFLLPIVMSVMNILAVDTKADIKPPAPNPLKIKIAVTKDKFKIGDYVVLKITLINKGKKKLSLKLPRITSFGLLYKQPLIVRMYDEKSGKGMSLLTSRVNSPLPVIGEHFLKPGERISLEYDLFVLLGVSFGTSHPPGKYVFIIQYKNAGIDSVSDKTTITIEENTKGEKEALGLYKKSSCRKASRDSAIKRLQLLCKKFPAAPITDRAKALLAKNLFRSGKEKEAAELWRNLLKVRSTGLDRDRVRWLLARYLHEEGHLEEAIKILEPVSTERARIRVKMWKNLLKNKSLVRGEEKKRKADIKPPDPNPLKTKIVVTKDKFKIGDYVALKIAFINKGKKKLSLKLPSRTSFGLIYKQPLIVRVYEEKSCKEISLRAGQTFGPFLSTRGHFLKPGKRILLEYDLFILLDVSISPGKYVIQTQYKSDGIDSMSDKTTIIIEENTKEEKEALGLYKKARKEVGDVAIETLQLLCKKFPAAPITDRAKVLLAEKLFLSGKKKEATELWKKLLKARSTGRDMIRWLLANYLHKNGRFEEAIKVLSPVSTETARDQVMIWKIWLEKKSMVHDEENKRKAETSSPVKEGQ